MLKGSLLAAAVALGAASEMDSVGTWRHVGDADAGARLSLTVGVRQEEAAREALFAAVKRAADPRSPAYGQHMTVAEADAMVAPLPETVAAVEAWLAAAGAAADACEHTPTSDFITCDVSVAEAERLLGVDYHEYRSSETGKRILRTRDEPRLPAEVDVVGPATRFPVERLLQVQDKLVGDLETTPDYLRELYGFANVTAQTDTAVATANFLEQYISTDDLQQFFDAYAPSLSGDTVSKWIGENDESEPGIESSLDIDYVMGVAQKAPFWFWYTAGRSPDDPDNEPFLVWLQDITARGYVEDLPAVFSISYADYENTVSVDYQNKCDTYFAKLSAAGISFITGSGDAGVEGAQPRDCPDGLYSGVYPADSYWLTSAGATQPTGAGGAEVSTDWSGGGFSWNITTADFQADAVANFLDTSDALPPSGVYNAGGRGFPDVSTIGVDFAVVQGGKVVNVGGTSAATPTFASVVTLLNDARVAAGKSTLGFLNPLLYSNPDMFTDVTEGSNPGCGGPGFTAQAGWDPLTGLGSPNFQKMLDVVLALP